MVRKFEMNNWDLFLSDLFGVFLRYAPIVFILFWLFSNFFSGLKKLFTKSDHIKKSTILVTSLFYLVLIVIVFLLQISPFYSLDNFPNYIDIIIRIINGGIFILFWGVVIIFLLPLLALGHASGSGAPSIQATLKDLSNAVFNQKPKESEFNEKDKESVLNGENLP